MKNTVNEYLNGIESAVKQHKVGGKPLPYSAGFVFDSERLGGIYRCHTGYIRKRYAERVQILHALQHRMPASGKRSVLKIYCATMTAAGFAVDAVIVVGPYPYH